MILLEKIHNYSIGIVLIFCTFIFTLAACDKIEPGRLESVTGEKIKPELTGFARIQKITEWYEAVGTVKPRTETKVEAQVTAKILDVKVSPGNEVSKGQLLISLDDRQLKTRLEQAKEAYKYSVSGGEQARQEIAGKEASFKKAEAGYRRINKYFQSQAATAQQLENSESLYLQAKAEVSRSKEILIAAKARIRQAEAIVRESTIGLGYAKIISTEPGVVLRRFVDPGDLAIPGKPLITLRTNGFFRLEAHIREGLISKVNPPTKIKVNIQTIGKNVDAVIEEIVPYADPQSRTFLVKAALPEIKGLFPGMFGKLLIPVEEHDVVVIPRNSVRHIGQIELVYVKENDKWQMRYITTGKVMGEDIEVLSGLNGSETIGWEARKDG